MFGLAEVSLRAYALVVLVICAVFNVAVWLYYAFFAKKRTALTERIRLRKFAEEKETEEKEM